MPLKRIQKLIPLSHEHHDSLLLCWKIRDGIKRNIESERIHKYLKWYWEIILNKHFEKEEEYIFPILGLENQLIKKLMAQHVEIKNSIEQEYLSQEEIKKLERTIFHHIRLEERELFEILQNEFIEKLPQIEKEQYVDDYSDIFWEVT